MNLMRAWVEHATDRSTVRRALATSAVVGAILTLANHGEEVLGGSLEAGHVWPIALTFIVPYVVATVSSIWAVNGQMARLIESGRQRGAAQEDLPMKASGDVRDAMLRFYDRFSANDVASFDQLVSMDPATLVIGTAPGEWVTERDRLRYGFEAEGLAIEAGSAPAGYEHRSVGWFVDEPDYLFPDRNRMHTRLTALLQREDDNWRVVHMHVSVGVPDDEVVELQRRWQADEAPPRAGLLAANGETWPSSRR